MLKAKKINMNPILLKLNSLLDELYFSTDLMKINEVWYDIWIISCNMLYSSDLSTIN